ncbi:MAG: phosphatidylserine decarboxylase [Verrucomicrobia bacterium]|nr:phosphatidylserine decarboxylase [Verrucomicrobiota bacterium]MBU1910242.1 phosphatidylserine decarboxylase [Verrucomicrobiota bacterium]
MTKKAAAQLILIGFVSATICSWSRAGEPDMDPLPPCRESIHALDQAYATNAEFKTLLDAAFENMQQLPSAYPDGNPWIGKGFQDLVDFLGEWCTFLPTAQGSGDTGLKYIQQFAFFYYHNEYGVQFVQTSPGREIMQAFVRQRGAFMDSPASTAEIANWLSDPRMEKEDYNLPDPDAPDGGFKSFNEFFSRTLKDQARSRPQTMPEHDYVITAPTDAIMNSIPQKITDEGTLIPTKFNEALNIKDMLGGSEYAGKFVGGTALSCVLMPNTYHHYHAPVSGKVVESRIIEGAFYGYNDFPVWASPSGNVGYYGTDFGQFGHFKRGYFIVDTGKYGYVGLIAVGLNTISSIVFKEPFVDVKEPVPVTRGDELGYFLYGGSLFIMVFEPDRFKSDAIQVRLGNQIGTFDTSSDSP